MFKQILIGLTLAVAAMSANAKTLKADCSAPSGESLSLVSDIANVNTPQKITSLTVGGAQESAFRDVSAMPIYQNGVLTLKIQFGSRLYSSTELTLTNCTDSFLATGQALLKKYVGGFAGTDNSNLKCSCSLN